MNIINKKIELPDGRVIEIETGKLAKQAAGSAVVMFICFTSVTSYVFLSSFLGFCHSERSEGISFIEKGGEILPCIDPIPRVFLSSNLSAETQLLDKRPVSLDVHLLKVVQKLTALTDQAEKGTTGGYVLLVLLHVLGKVSDTVGK